MWNMRIIIIIHPVLIQLKIIIFRDLSNNKINKKKEIKKLILTNNNFNKKSAVLFFLIDL